MKQLKKASPTILLMAVLLLAGIGYSIYRAASAFSVDVDSPAYDRSPSDRIVAPELETVIPDNDPIAIRSDQEGFRLPDRALFDLNEGTSLVGEALVGGGLDGALLEEIGYPGSNGERVAQVVEDKYLRFSSIGAEEEVSVSIRNDLASSVYAQSVLEVTATPEDVGEASSFLLYIGWLPARDGRWVPVAFSEQGL